MRRAGRAPCASQPSFYCTFRHEHPELPLILALTGTDLYGDIHTDASAQESLEMADRFILLQPAGIEELQKGCATKRG